MLRASRLRIALGLAVTCWAQGDVPSPVSTLEPGGRNLLDHDLSGWEIYLGSPHESLPWPDVTRSADGTSGPALGLGCNRGSVFSIRTEGSEPILHISGAVYGALTSREAYSNYHLHLEYRWGTRKWEPRLTQKRDSGLLYHAHGPHGAFWNAWKASLEFQIQEGDTGDFFALTGTSASVSVSLKGSKWRFEEDALPRPIDMYPNTPLYYAGRSQQDYQEIVGDWQTIDLYTFGDSAIHVVNGRVANRINDTRSGARRDHGRPLSSGQIQIQSEGAEIEYRRIVIRPIEALPVLP